MNRPAIVFDLDGTLIDSAPDIAAAINAVLGESGRRNLSLTEVRQMVGDGTQALVSRAFAAVGGAPLAESELSRHIGKYRIAYEERATRDTVPYPGVVETLRSLYQAGFRLGVCTNKPDRPARAIIEAFGMAPYIGALVGGDAPARKPDARHLRGTLDLLGAGPQEAVMVGDGINDVMVARALSVPVVIVTFGYSKTSPGSLGADAIIDRFDQLFEALKALDNGADRREP